jgi:DNA polymerase-3 subunit gamma/tau
MNVIEIDAASNNGVDNIRQIREEVQYSPSQGRFKVYIIDEVHMLSIGAFNALLKTLEEPPSYVIFILATTESHKIPITISSRCQKYDFRRISVEVIGNRLETLLQREQVEAEKEALNYIAKAADGSMRDALSILDQCIAFNLGQKLTYDKVLETIGAVDIDIFARLLERVMAMDVSGAIDIVDEVVWQGRELGRFVNDFTWFMRNVLIIKASPVGDKKLDMSAENLERIRGIAEEIDMHTLIRYINIFSEVSSGIKYAVQKRVVLELAVIKLCKPEMENNYDALLERIRVLENKLEQGVPVAATQVMTKEEVSAVPGEKAAANHNAGLKEKLEKELPEADFNELKEIIEQWDIIAGSYQNITARFVRCAKLNLAEDNKGLLFTIVDNKENQMAVDYFKDKERMAILKEKIEQITGRRVNITLRVINPVDAEKADIDGNDLLKINFNIEYK